MRNLNALKTFCAALTLMLVGFMVQSCGDCKDITCTNGECVDGQCECPAGYSGDLCQYADCSQTLCPIHADCELENGEGVCYCDCGYSGDTCGVEIRTSLFGTYAADDLCATVGGSTENFFYTATLGSVSGSADKFGILGFGGFDNPVLNVRASVCTPTSWDIIDTTYAATAGTNIQSIVGTSNGRIADSLGTKFLFTDYRITFPAPDNTIQDCDLVLRKN